MSNPAPTPAPSTPDPTPAKKTRAARGFIDQGIEDDIKLASDCSLEAAKTDVATALAARSWTAADQTLLTASLARCEDFEEKIREARTGTGTRSTDEVNARKALIHALDPILKGARRTYPDGSAERKAYGIGQKLSSDSTQDLLGFATYAASQLAPGPGNTPPKDVLKGVLPAEITAISQLAADYKNADWAHGDAQTAATELLAQLQKEVSDVLNPLRRDLQGAADQAYTHRDPVNAAQRQAFGLQPDKPMQD